MAPDDPHADGGSFKLRVGIPVIEGGGLVICHIRQVGVDAVTLHGQLTEIIRYELKHLCPGIGVSLSRHNVILEGIHDMVAVIADKVRCTSYSGLNSRCQLISLDLLTHIDVSGLELCEVGRSEERGCHLVCW